LLHAPGHVILMPAQVLNPTGGIHQLHFAASHLASSRILFKSSCLMKLGIEPWSRSERRSSRFRRLNCSTAVRIASLLVFARVCLIASASTFSGISIVV